MIAEDVTNGVGVWSSYTMFAVCIALALAGATNAELQGRFQLVDYAQAHPEGSGILTTSYGYPVTEDEAFNGLRRDSNLLSPYSYEQLSSFSAERIPARGTHAAGSGAKGYFEVTHDVSHITNAKFLNGIGKRSPVIVRFSQGTGEQGSSEVLSRNKGFAIKFYTEEGNMDLLGIHTNSFAIKDPVNAINFAHPNKPNPKTGVVSTLAGIDFIANTPTALLAFILVQLSKLGQPKSYRHIPGYAIHTYQVENKAGDVSFVKFNWLPDEGFQFLTNEEYNTIGATNPDYFTEDLYNAISNKTYPSWTLCMQVIPEKDVKTAKFDIFDITLNWPEKDYPNIPVGKIVLDKHVDNHFAEIELAAFHPANLVPGIRGTDKMFYTRSFIYRDSQIHRMGIGFNRIPVNCPLNEAKTFNRDGRPPVGDNGGDSINYYPNSFNGLVPSNRTQKPLVNPDTVPEPTNYWQVADYYYDLPEAEKTQLVQGLGATLAAVPPFINQKIQATLLKVDQCLAEQVDAAMKAILTAQAAAAQSG